jgi:hypothetical protein
MNPVNTHNLKSIEPSAVKDYILKVAKTDLETAVILAKEPENAKDRNNTLGKIVERCIKQRTDRPSFELALKYVVEIEPGKDLTRALERIVRHARKAGEAMSESDRREIEAKVQALAQELGAAPEEHAKKRGDASLELQEIALQETHPLRAFYAAATMQTGRDKVLPVVVDKFTLDVIQKADKKIFSTERQNLLTRREKALELDHDAKNKELNKIAYEFAAMTMLDDAKETIEQMRKDYRKEHTLDGKLIRLVAILAKDHLEEFSQL